MITLMSILLWLVTIPDLAPALGELGYMVERYDESPGIYYENKGQVNLYNTEWQVVVYVDLKETSNQSHEVEMYIKHINYLCQEIAVQNWTDCYHFSDIARDRLLQIKRTESLIVDISDHRAKRTRRRRGVFNFVGEISKVLFGTMDDEDATYYSERIRHFEENSNDMTKLLRQQLFVVKSSLGAVNNTLTDIEYNQEKVKKGMKQIKNYLDSFTAESRQKVNMVAAKILVESHIARVSEALGTIQRNLDILLQSITNARKGILEPRIISPKLIMDALIQSMPSFPKDTAPPFALSKDSLNLIYRVCAIHVYINNNVLGYVISLPLISRGVFREYKMIPIPISLGNNKFAYVRTEEPNLCVDDTRQYYFGMSDAESNNCKDMDDQVKICKQLHPLLSSHLQESCAVKLLHPRVEFPKNCDTRLVQVKNTIWAQLDNNEWLYFAPATESVTILCTDKDPSDVTLTGVGKIALNPGCKGYSSVALLQTNVLLKAKAVKREDIISRIPFDLDCLEEIGIRFNTSNSPINFEFKHVASHLDDLRHASYKISELEKEINEQEWKNHQSSTHATYSTIVYIVLSILGIYVIYKLYKLYKYLRERFTPTRGMQALTAPLREVQTSTRTDGTGNTVNINIKTSNESLSVGSADIPLQPLEEDTKPRRSLRSRVAKSYF
jgi:hypothetical protein